MSENEQQQTQVATKRCVRCGKEKSRDSFYSAKGLKDGLRNWCKLCYKKYNADRSRIAKEARKNAEENPADRKAVEDFRKENTFPPQAVRKSRQITHRNVRTGEKTLQLYKSTFLEGYRNLAALGLDESTIERLFGLKNQFLMEHIETDEEYQLAYRQAMDELQSKMARLMISRAIGYDYEEEKTIYCKKDLIRKKKDNSTTAVYNKQLIGGGRWIEYRKEIMKKHQPGDTQMFIFFMTNRFPDQWKVSRELLTGRIEGYDSSPGERIRRTIEALSRDVLEQNTDRAETEHSVQDGPAQPPVGSGEDGKK